MNFVYNKTWAYVMMCTVCVLSVGWIAQAQHRWIDLDTFKVRWISNGTHVHNDRGGVGIGMTSPPSGTLLGVSGQVGGTAYCDGAGLNCFAAPEILWRSTGVNSIYSTNSGNIGIGTSTLSQKVTVDGAVLATGYLYSSDQQLKQNIHPITNGLDIVTQLQGVTFNRVNSKETSIGLVAQQVETVLPELVFTDPTTGYKSVQYANVVAPLIEAIKEQHNQLEQLRMRIESLQNRKRLKQ